MKKFWVLISIITMFATKVYAKDIRFVQITDTKFNSNSQTCLLQEAIKDINKLKNVDFVVFTGDNIDKPNPEDLKAFLNVVKNLNCPFYFVIGEHDVNKHKNMSKIEYVNIIKKQIKKYKPENPNYKFEKSGVVFLVVDGSKDVIPSSNGFYKEKTLEWLKQELTLSANKNVIILQHFPLIPPAQKELYYTYNPERYLKLISEHKNVKAVISGHFGINKDIVIDGVNHISTAPLPSYRIIDILDCDTTNPTIWAELKQLP